MKIILGYRDPIWPIEIISTLWIFISFEPIGKLIFIFQWPICMSVLWSHLDFPCGSDDKVSAYNAGDLGSIPGEGNGNPLQYSCLENPMDGVAC